MPKGMEWYAAFGLLVTVVWLYLEILRLLSKLQPPLIPTFGARVRASSRSPAARR